MNILKNLKMETAPNDGGLPAGAPSLDEMTSEQPSSGGSDVVDEEVDSEMADMFGSVDDELFNDGEVKGDGETLPPEPQTRPEPSEVVPPTAEPQPEPQASVQEAETSQTPPTSQEVPQSVPEQPVQQPADETPPVDLVAMRQQAEAELQKRYALSKEDADAMISEPETVLPRIASQLYLDVFDDVMRNVQQMLPQAVQHITKVSQAMQEGETKFYTQWPALRQHSNEVMRIGQIYRQLNPQASAEQFIQDVGLQSMIQLKLPIQGQPVATAPQTPPSAPPYTPPRGGSVNTPPAPQQPQNPFAQLADEWEEDW